MKSIVEIDGLVCYCLVRWAQGWSKAGAACNFYRNSVCAWIIGGN